MNSDDELIRKLINSSYSAFKSLYERYFSQLYGFAFSLTRSHYEAQELVQNTFIKVWIHRADVNPALSFKAWLFKIARNDFLDKLKAQMNKPVFEDYLEHCANENLTVNPDESSFDFDAFRLLLAKAKKTLSPRQCEVFELICEKDYNHAEVAKHLQISEQAVYNYLSQAMAALRTYMKPHKNLIMFMLLFENKGK